MTYCNHEIREDIQLHIMRKILYQYCAQSLVRISLPLHQNLNFP